MKKDTATAAEIMDVLSAIDEDDLVKSLGDVVEKYNLNHGPDGRFSSGGGGGGTRLGADTGGGSGGGIGSGKAKSVADNDNDIETGRKNNDFKMVVEALKNIHKNGPKVAGFADGKGGDRQVRHAKGSDDIKTSKKSVDDTMKKAGYLPSGKAKMQGGSETIQSYKHPKYQNHKYLLHSSPRTRHGEKESFLTLSVEQSWAS